MKQVNNFIVLAFLLFCIAGFSQDIESTTEDNPLSKGTIFLSGQSSFRAGLNGIDDSSSKNSSYSISPTIGYFLIDNLVVGAGVNMFGSKSTRNISEESLIYERESRSKGVLITPFARYYFNTGKIKPYIDASIGYGNGRGSSESITIVNDVETTFDGTSKNSTTRYSVTGGAAIFLSKDISIDTGIRYDKGDSKSEPSSGSGNESESSFSALNLVGGISIYL
jgi:outer membrane protein